MILRIISGGQTGADRGGLEAARDLGIQTGGWAPVGYKTEDGPDLTLKDFGLREGGSYQDRTSSNVNEADGTVWFGKTGTPGHRSTMQAVLTYHRPYLRNPTPEGLRVFCLAYNIQVLNVAGNRESTNAGIAARVKATLLGAFGHRREDVLAIGRIHGG